MHVCMEDVEEIDQETAARSYNDELKELTGEEENKNKQKYWLQWIRNTENYPSFEFNSIKECCLFVIGALSTHPIKNF